ncbi:hypothetical protein GCM10027341_04030 [Spirosoma knui]
MIYILANIQIQVYAQFIAVFTAKGKEDRQRHGCQRTQVYTTTDPNALVVLFDWSSRQDFDGFLADPSVKETMKASGTMGPPTFTFLDKVGELPG